VLETEVLVVGAGPAGAALAINLAPSKRVTLIEGQTRLRPHIGESLPPATGRLLAAMGLLESFLAQGHAPCYGNRMVWGAREPAETDFLRDPDGHGWHLNRTKFDAWMRAAAVARGAELITPARVVEVWREGVGWRALLTTARGGLEVSARLIVDASGRAAVVARRMGARRRLRDHLVCRWLSGSARSHGPGAGFTYLEAVEDGWWYSAPSPDDRRVLAFHTDSDLQVAKARRGEEMLRARAQAVSELASVLNNCAFSPGPECGLTAAHSARLDPCVGPGWMAAGDAALSFDPLSSQGLFNALYTGLAAAEAAYNWLSGDGDAFANYAEVLVRIWNDYTRQLDFWYRNETRWPDAPFWSRRRGIRLAR